MRGVTTADAPRVRATDIPDANELDDERRMLEAIGWLLVLVAAGLALLVLALPAIAVQWWQSNASPREPTAEREEESERE